MRSANLGCRIRVAFSPAHGANRHNGSASPQIELPPKLDPPCSGAGVNGHVGGGLASITGAGVAADQHPQRRIRNELKRCLKGARILQEYPVRFDRHRCPNPWIRTKSRWPSRVAIKNIGKVFRQWNGVREGNVLVWRTQRLSIESHRCHRRVEGSRFKKGQSQSVKVMLFGNRCAPRKP